MRVVFIAYRNTLQADALRLAVKKLQSPLAVECSFLGYSPGGPTRTWSVSPRSSRACCNSNWKPCARLDSMLTENLTPTFRSSPDRSLGRSLVPRRFHTSGGTVPVSSSRVLWPR